MRSNHESIDAGKARLEQLCQRHRVQTLAIFGSAVGDAFDPDTSDFDFLVRFQPMSPGEHADSYFGLLADLESLCDRPIDLVEEDAIENPYFRRSIEDSRRVLYDAA